MRGLLARDDSPDWQVMTLGRSKPAGNEELADVLFGVFAHAVDRTGAGPEHRPRQVVRVALDHRGEEVDGGGFVAKALVGVVEVLAGLGDRPLGVVVEVLVLVPADDVPGLEGFDLVDRLSPGPEAVDVHTLPDVQVGAVVDHISGDDKFEIGDVEDAGLVGVGVADLNHLEIVSFEREAVARPVTAVIGDGGMPGYALSHRSGRKATLTSICAIDPAVATTGAPNRSANDPAANQ